MKILYKSMSLENNNCTVKILGDFIASEVIVKMSILQLAKIFNSDKSIIEKVKGAYFGDGQLEEKCIQTMELVKKYPNINVKGEAILLNRITSFDVSRNESGKILSKTAEIFAEDLSGWSNEGIRIEMPTESYIKYLSQDKIIANEKRKIFELNYSMVLKWDSIEFKKKRNPKQSQAIINK
jgi:hypothetical protein